MIDPLREAISMSLTAVRESTDPVQTPPRAALPDIAIDVGLEPPEAAATSRIQRADRPPVVLENLAALQDLLSQASALTSLVNGSSLLYGAPRDRGPTLLPLHAVLESVHLPMEDDVSNGPAYKQLKTLSFALF